MISVVFNKLMIGCLSPQTPTEPASVVCIAVPQTESGAAGEDALEK